jgi:hypothetical protein
VRSGAKLRGHELAARLRCFVPGRGEQCSGYQSVNHGSPLELVAPLQLVHHPSARDWPPKRSAVPTGAVSAQPGALRAQAAVVAGAVASQQALHGQIHLVGRQPRSLKRLSARGHALDFSVARRVAMVAKLGRHGWHGCRSLALRSFPLGSFTLRGVAVHAPQARTLSASLAAPLPPGAARRATPVVRQVGIVGFAHRWQGSRLRFALDFIDFSCNACNTRNAAQ